MQSLNNVNIIKENKLQNKKKKLRKKKLLRESLNSDRADSDDEKNSKNSSIYVYVYISDDFIMRSGRIKSSDFERLSVIT